MRPSCDTSVLVPAFLPFHERHRQALRGLGGAELDLPAHVLLETYSVLTRLPAPHRMAPAAVLAALQRVTGSTLTLPGDGHLETVVALAAAGITGGAVYDGLVGMTAREHDRTLLTLDRRALPAYEAVGVRVRLL
ncbi:type II toxin-antitoxin system VapC family toxin [Ornithinimicrobium sp. W1665]|uniref:type II toxin-antitoxin system VapC family toxin n=1 Tax=Ornithinimicrobium sp. W1665 TaxID=3416666 RepID=UPI003CF054F9